MLNEIPIKHNSREELVYYICDLHNHVNKRLGKPIFECKKAFDFWGGDCGCDAKHELESETDQEYNSKNHTEIITK